MLLGAGNITQWAAALPAELGKLLGKERGAAMSWPDLLPQFEPWIGEVRGRLIPNQMLSEITWFRVGGPAQLFFQPADEADLAFFLKHLPADIRVTIIGLGSNLLIRDGGLDGVVIRLSAKGFGGIEMLDGHRVRVGTALPDVKVATAAAEAGIDGLDVLSRHSRRHRRRALHERRLLRHRDARAHGRAARGHPRRARS